MASSAPANELEESLITADLEGEPNRKRDDGRFCSKRCGRSTTIKMMLAQAFVVLTSVSLVKAIVLSILFDVHDTVETSDSTQSWLPEIRAVLPYLSYVAYPLTGSILTGVMKRYDLVRRSLGATWAATIGTSALLVLYEANYVNVPYTAPVFVTAYLALTAALAVFHSNLVPLGLEQLESAKPQEVVTFLHAYLGLESLAYGVALLYPPLALCDAAGSRKAAALSLSFACAALVTTATAFALLCHDHVMIEEPNYASNPLRLIFRVAWYSKRVHSCRYTISQNISGVPFSKKEVDDVKSFFRFLPLFLPLGLVMATYTATGSTYPYLLPLANTTACNAAPWVGSVPYLATPTFMLLYHAYNLFCSDHLCLKLVRRVIFGVAVMTACIIVALILALVKQFVLGQLRSEQPALFGLEVMVSAASGISVFLTASAVVEFVCAQSSVPMKTLLVNFKYMADGLGTIIGIVLLTTVFRLGYVIWYLSASTILAVLGVGLSVWNAKRYRMRKRDEKRYEDLTAERVSIFSSVTSSSITPDPSSVV